jgi:hypothetical protein
MTYLDIIKKSCNDIIIKNNDKERYLNEKSVQMKLAFDFWKEKNIEPELEKCFNYKSYYKTYTDIYINSKIKIGIEIKFKTRKVKDFQFVNQGAVTNGKLNSLVDIKRLLGLKKKKEIDFGYFLFITNDYLYWKTPRIGKSNSHEYSFENEKKINSKFKKPNWSSRTYSDEIDLTSIKTEKIIWNGEDKGVNKNSFRYFIIEI